jgi:uncharacterized protein YbjT (DUF2867 family)
MRVLVIGSGGFVGAHVEAALRAAGHEVADEGAVDAVFLLAPDRARAVLDESWGRGARRVVLLSTIGADRRARKAQLAARGKAEELVRAAGLPWVILRAELLWGPGDVLTNEIAHLLRHLPFVPLPKDGAPLAPVFVGDAARAMAAMLDREGAWGREWLLVGPEVLQPSDLVGRVAGAIGLERRRSMTVPPWAVRMGIALEERIARRPRATRALVDRLLAGHADVGLPAHAVEEAPTFMSVEALREYLGRRASPIEQLVQLT